MREYSKVGQSLWQSKRFTKLSDDARFLYLYLLTCPHGNSIGCFKLPSGYATADLGWSEDRYKIALSETSDSTLIDLFKDENLVRIDLFLVHNPITNAKHALGSAKLALALPNVEIKTSVINDLMSQRNIPHDDVVHEFDRAIEELSNGYCTETETETETEIEEVPTGKRATELVIDTHRGDEDEYAFLSEDPSDCNIPEGRF